MMFTKKRPHQRRSGSMGGWAGAVLALMGSALALPAQAQITWSAPERIDQSVDGVPGHTRVATDGVQLYGVSNWISVWEAKLEHLRGEPTIIRAAHSSTNGDTWTPGVRLAIDTDSTTDPFPLNNNLPSCHRPEVAADATSRDFVVVWDSETTTGHRSAAIVNKSDIGYALFDGEAGSWVTTGSLLLPSMTDDSSSDYAPSVASDNNGKWMVVWRSRDVDLESTAPPAMRLKASSSNDGITWSDPVVIWENVHPEAEPVVRSNGAGQWVVLWSGVNLSKVEDGNTTAALDIISVYSEDHGATWSAPRRVSGQTERSPDIRPRLVFTPGRGWVAAWTRLRDSEGPQVVTNYTAHPNGWNQESVPANLDTSSDGDISLATDGRTATILAWKVNGPEEGKIQYAVSRNFGASWQPSAALAAQGKALSAPALGTDAQGKWVAVFSPNEKSSPLFSTTLIPMPGKTLQDLVVTSHPVVQPPTEPEHPVFTDLPMDVTFTITNKGVHAASNWGIYVSVKNEDFTYLGPAKEVEGTHIELENNDVDPAGKRIEITYQRPLLPGQSTDVTLTFLPKAAGAKVIGSHVFSQYDPYLKDNDAPMTIAVAPLPPLADLITTVRSYPDSTSVGNGGYNGIPMALIVEVFNDGDDAAESVILDEILEELVRDPDTGQLVPAFTFTHAATTQGSWRYERLGDGRGRIICNFGEIPNRGKATLVIAVTPTRIGTFSHGALARSFALRSFDLTPADAYASGPFKVTEQKKADLGVELEASETSVVFNGQVTFTATVTNNGPDKAHHPRVVLNVPAGAEIRGVRHPGGSFSRSTNAVVASFRALADGESATIQVDAIMRRSGAGTASATVSNYGAHDSEDENNSDPVVVTTQAEMPAASASARVAPASGAVLPGAFLLSPASEAGGDGNAKKEGKSAKKKARVKPRTHLQSAN